MDRPTPNSARTARTYPVDPGHLLPAVRRAVEGLPRWRLASSEEDEVLVPDAAANAEVLEDFRDASPPTPGQKRSPSEGSPSSEC